MYGKFLARRLLHLGSIRCGRVGLRIRRVSSARPCRASSSDEPDQKKVNDTTYNEYRVEIKLAEAKVNDQLRLQEFKDSVKVYVVAK
ncbi:MAG: hypothetical protein MUF18_18070 [Fimbriiglobus sp.]|jgi:hypothetical protein|nr:hypothetical protein [Fimbriiglobus sp.]